MQPSVGIALPALLLALAGSPARAHADDETTFVAIGGTVIFVDLAFTAGALMGPHSRTYGFIEMGVHAPLAAMNLYAAGQTGNRGASSVMYVAAGWSAALSLHGLWTVLRGDGLQRTAMVPRGTSVAPTLVSDGRLDAPGLAVLGSF